jgi:hypothetical protein
MRLFVVVFLGVRRLALPFCTQSPFKPAQKKERAPRPMPPPLRKCPRSSAASPPRTALLSCRMRVLPPAWCRSCRGCAACRHSCKKKTLSQGSNWLRLYGLPRRQVQYGKHHNELTACMSNAPYHNNKNTCRKKMQKMRGENAKKCVPQCFCFKRL